MRKLLLIIILSMLSAIAGCARQTPQEALKAGSETGYMAQSARERDLKVKGEAGYAVQPVREGTLRAEGQSDFGRLEIVSVGREKLERLGAPSVYGRAEDYSITGDYEVIFRGADGGETVVSEIDGLGLIQQEDSVVELGKLSTEGEDIFYFTPQYSGANDVEIIFFGVTKDGDAFRFGIESNKALEAGDPAALSDKTLILPALSDDYVQPAVNDGNIAFRAVYNIGEGQNPEVYNVVFHVDQEGRALRFVSKERKTTLDDILFARVEEADRPQDKLWILFKALDDDSYENRTTENNTKVLSRTMELLYEFLNSKESAAIADKAFEAQFTGVSILPLKAGRLVLYSGKPATFGESSDSRYAFCQVRRGDRVCAYKIYEHDFLRVHDAFIKTEGRDSALLYTTGITSMNMWGRKFINAFRITPDSCSAVKPLEGFKYRGGPLLEPDGLIPREFSLAQFTDKGIVLVSDSDGKKLEIAP